MTAAILEAGLAALLPAGLKAEAVTRVAGGGNNQLYRVRTAAADFALKRYFRDPDDPRERLGAEFAFSTLAWESGIHCLPKPVAQDPTEGLGLYAWVEGRSLRPAAVGDREVQEALDFLLRLQRLRPRAGHLRAASEAAFSLRAHLEILGGRIRRLGSVADPQARAFVQDRLRPAWEALRAKLQASPDLDRELAPEERILSPSDFGFHNVLRRPDGGLVFLDFEYAGWDDPAKTTGDFFSQVALPAPPAAFDGFAGALAAALPDPPAVLVRMRRLRPLYRLKWCCIVLNAYLAPDQRRRAFAEAAKPVAPAGAPAGAPCADPAQLDKAGTLLDSLPEPEP